MSTYQYVEDLCLNYSELTDTRKLLPTVSVYDIYITFFFFKEENMTWLPNSSYMITCVWITVN